MEFTKDGDRICSVFQGSKSVLLVALLYCVTVFASLIGDANVPVTVNRRLNGDIYTNFNSTDSSACHDDNNLTFLVNERKCVNNQELFKGNNYLCLYRAIEH